MRALLLLSALSLPLALLGCGGTETPRPGAPVTAASEATLAGIVRHAGGRPFPNGELVVLLVDPKGGAPLAQTTASADGTSAEVPFLMTVAAGPLAAAGAEPRFAVRDTRSGRGYAVQRREQFYRNGKPTVVLTVKG